MIRVNGELINPELLEEAFTRIKSEAELRTQVSCCERDEEFSKAAEEEVIDSILIAQEAEKTHQDLDEGEVVRRLEELIKTYREHGASWEMLEAERDHLRDEVSANLRMEKFIAEHIPAVAEPDEEALASFYEEKKGEYCSLPEARCLHLMRLIDGHEDPKENLASVVALRKRLLAGEDFETLAKAETEKESKEVDLGWIPLDRPTNPFETVLFSLEVGEISPVLSYEHALHVVQVVERRGGEAPPLEEIAGELSRRYVTEKRQAALRELAGRLRAEATIERVDFEQEAEEEDS
ncbi:peptidylprolyl isomerase [Roseibacillus ishigakijimensis]|uniref:Peptidyl-prolyl cis-trans isomerase n=1 Tax=Roseibacillus ishigakijimensis TaxID=454146 RepID=A0A934RMF7_9BACT|nr:peptidylprolyl isomerase [Roseibacillus ishigakijimensis]MBK1834487.1 peptidyl-prolyl cis-trans isomerase [Roseibacillus ishigakijimensis]